MDLREALERLNEIDDIAIVCDRIDGGDCFELDEKTKHKLEQRIDNIKAFLADEYGMESAEAIVAIIKDDCDSELGCKCSLDDMEAVKAILGMLPHKFVGALESELGAPSLGESWKDADPYDEPEVALAKEVATACRLGLNDYYDLLDDLKNLRGGEWLDTVEKCGDEELIAEFKKFTHADDSWDDLDEGRKDGAEDIRPTEEQKQNGIECDWGDFEVEHGYGIFDEGDNEHPLEVVCRIDDMGVFSGDKEAADQARRDGYKFLKLEPSVRQRLWHDWDIMAAQVLDTENNRKNIEFYKSGEQLEEAADTGCDSYICHLAAKCPEVTKASKEAGAEEGEIREGYTFLAEDLKGYVKNHYLDMFMDDKAIQSMQDMEPRAKKRAEDEAYAKALNVAKLDPTFKGRSDAKPEDALKKDKGAYFEWLIRLLKKGVLTYEQMMQNSDAFIDQLSHFDDLKRRNKIPADKRDIMRYKSPEEISELINSLGGDIDVSQAETSSDFKTVVRNIRGALQAICGFKDDEIPEDIQKTSDCFTFVCENSKWEVWQIESIWGAMLADTYGIEWGGGATWCTGGQYLRGDRPRKGMELYDSAKMHYPTYTGKGNKLVFFQQKDNSVPRPKNKAQVTVNNNYGVSNFFHANDNPIGLDSNGELSYTGGGYGHSTSEVMTVFISQEDLLQPLKGSFLKGIEPIADADNLARLQAGEPYEYAGGKIKDTFKTAINLINFEIDGKKHQVSAKEHPEYLKCETVEDMANMERLIAGEPYIYNGDRIKEMFKPSIREIKFVDGYNKQVSTRDAQGNLMNVIGVDKGAFSGCINLEKVTLPASIVQLGMNVFKDCKKVHITTPRYPDRPFRYWPSDAEFYQEHLFYEDGEHALKAPKKSEGESGN